MNEKEKNDCEKSMMKECYKNYFKHFMIHKTAHSKIKRKKMFRFFDYSIFISVN